MSNVRPHNAHLHLTMEEILKTVSSPGWWITAVLFGIVINLASAYLKGPLDRIGGSLSSSWRNRNEKSRREHRERLDALRSNTNLQFFVLLEALQLRASSSEWLTVACMLVVAFGADLQIEYAHLLIEALSKTTLPIRVDRSFFLLGIAAICMFVASWNTTRAKYRESLVREVQELT